MKEQLLSKMPVQQILNSGFSGVVGSCLKRKKLHRVGFDPIGFNTTISEGTSYRETHKTKPNNNSSISLEGNSRVVCGNLKNPHRSPVDQDRN